MPKKKTLSFPNDAESTFNERDLVGRAKNGDRRAFTLIMEHHRDRLFRAALAILGDREEALDICQEVFVKAYFKLSTFRGESGLYTWLYRILYNMSMTSLRKSKPSMIVSVDDDDVNLEVPSGLESPLESIERSETGEKIREAIAMLPERQRTVFVLKQVEGLKLEEIAGIMGITVGAVKANHFQAIQKMRSLLKEYANETDVQ